MRLNKHQIADLCRQYQSGASTYQLAEKYGISQPAVYKLLKRRAIILRSASDARRKLMLNEHAFELVTEESAYWIGFLMAVGSIIQRGPASVDIALALRAHDFSHLERFRAFLGSSHAITCTGVMNHAPTHEQTLRFAVRSKRLADTLATYGVVPGKAHTAKVIGLENNRDFWRGVIDGRGMLTYLNQQARLELLGPEMLLEQFLMFVRQHLEVSYVTLRPYRNTYRIAAVDPPFMGGTAFSIVKVLYENCSVALARKLEIVIHILAECQQDHKESLQAPLPAGQVLAWGGL